MCIQSRRNLIGIFFILMLFFTLTAQAFEKTFVQQQLHSSNNERLMFGKSEIAVLTMVRNIYQYNDYQLLWQNSSKINVTIQ